MIHNLKKNEITKTKRSGNGSNPRRAPGWFAVVMLSGIAADLYLNLFVFPKLPYLLGGDQAYFWMNAQRMLYGDRPYRDFFQFTPPGADLVFFALFKLFGGRIWVTDAVILALGVALCWVCFSVAVRIMDRWLALLATLLFLTLIYSKLLNATHHLFSVLLVMCAAAIAMRGLSPPRIAAAGALLGAASFFTQTHGAAALLAITILLLWERFRTRKPWRTFLASEGLLIANFAVTLLALSAYFIATIGLKQLWYFQVTYVLKFMVHGPETEFLGMPDFPTWRTLPAVASYFFVYILLPVTYTVALKRQWCERHNPSFRHREIGLLSLIGLFLLVEVVFSLNWLRVFAVSMPGIILLVWVIGATGRIRRYMVALVWTGIICIILHQRWVKHHQVLIVAELPAGKAAVAPLAYEKLSWMMRHTRPDDFFFEAPGPTMYLPLQVRNPVYLDAAGTSEETRPEDVEATVRQLETRRVRYVLWSTRQKFSEDPARPWTDHLAPLRAYLQDRYVRVWIFSNKEEIWERKQAKCCGP